MGGLFCKPFTGDRAQDAASLIFTQHRAPSEAFLEKCCHRNQAAVQIARGRPAAMVAGAGAGAGKAAAGVPGWRIPHPPSSAPPSLLRAAVVLPCQRGWCPPQVASPPHMHGCVNVKATPAGKLPATSLPRGQAQRCTGLRDSWDRAMLQPSPITHVLRPWHLLDYWRTSLRGLKARPSSKAALDHPEPTTAEGPTCPPRRGFKTGHAW